MEIFIIISILILALSAGCGGHHEAVGAIEEKETTEPKRVRAAPATLESFERVVAAYGSLAPFEESVVGVEVSGVLESISVDLGSPVSRGDTMAVMESEQFEFRLEQSKALVTQALSRLGLSEGDIEGRKVDLEDTSEVQRAAALLEDGRRNLDRARTLFEDGVVSQSEIESAQTAYQVAANRYQESLNEARTRLAQLDQRRAEMKLAQQQLADTRIIAPFDGHIQRRYSYVGEFLNVGDPIVMLVRSDILRLRLEVTEKDSVLIKLGQEVKLTVTGDESIYSGSIKRISPRINEQSRMLVVEAEVPNPGSLRAGQFATALVVVNPQERVLAVPENSLVSFAGIEKVICVVDGAAVEKPVETGRRQKGMIEILTGIDEGDMVIIDPGNIRSGKVIIDQST
jgi:HlyD family secretion protein